MLRRTALAVTCAAGFGVLLHSQQQDNPVLAYPLPDPLRMTDGRAVKSAQMWRDNRRPELLRIFAEEVYGRTPPGHSDLHFQVDSSDDRALNGTAIRKQVTIFFSHDEAGPRMHLLLYLPEGAQARIPVFLGLNFRGNQAVAADPGITLPAVWTRARPDAAYQKRQTDESTRGSEANQWQVARILQHGFGLVTTYCGDIEPDFLGGIGEGVRPLFFRPGQSSLAPDEWGTLGAWAWGLSRAMDYLEKDGQVDAQKVAIVGHSRLGKSAMWSAAQDERFAIVISNESGKGGASLYRAAHGETIEHLNTAFPYWFCENFHRYTGHPDNLPVDGNSLLSLMAPRPLYVASAEQDVSSDPPAEFLSDVNASRVYELLGKPGLQSARMPALNQPVIGWLGCHVRAGKHDITAFDWDQYLLFAEKHFGKQR